MVWQYVPVDLPEESGLNSLAADSNSYTPPLPADDQLLPEPSEYAIEVMQRARELGFQPLGVFRDARGKLYRMRYNFWLSPQRDVLALVANGTIAKIPIKGTSLHTFLGDVRCLITHDNNASSPWDMTGLFDEAGIPNIDFGKLLDYHRIRIADSLIPPVMYSEDDPLGEYRAFLVRWAEHLEMLGYARFIDIQRNVWRYSFKGAVTFAIRLHLNGIRRTFWSDKRRVDSLTREREFQV